MCRGCGAKFTPESVAKFDQELAEAEARFDELARKWLADFEEDGLAVTSFRVACALRNVNQRMPENVIAVALIGILRDARRKAAQR